MEANPDYFMPQQFNNLANPEAHRRTTGPEIVAAMCQEPIDGFVAGIGTGGTITGVGEVLRKHYKNVKVVGVEPLTSAVLSGNAPGPHKINGIGAGFKPNVLNLDIVDEILPVSDKEAFEFSQKLAKEEGLLVGFSAGAACSAREPLRVAEGLKPTDFEAAICMGSPVLGLRPIRALRFFTSNVPNPIN